MQRSLRTTQGSRWLSNWGRVRTGRQQGAGTAAACASRRRSAGAQAVPPHGAGAGVSGASSRASSHPSSAPRHKGGGEGGGGNARRTAAERARASRCQSQARTLAPLRHLPPWRTPVGVWCDLRPAAALASRLFGAMDIGGAGSGGADGMADDDALSLEVSASTRSCVCAPASQSSSAPGRALLAQA